MPKALQKNKTSLIITVFFGVLISATLSPISASAQTVPAIVEFGVTPAVIEVGQTAIIYWAGLNARECVTYGDWDRSFGYDVNKRFTDTEHVSPREPGTYTYGLKCRGEAWFTPAREVYLVVGSISPSTTGGNPQSVGSGNILQTILGVSAENKNSGASDQNKSQTDLIDSSGLEGKITELEQRIDNLPGPDQAAQVSRAQSFMLWFILALIIINFGFLFYLSARIGKLERKQPSEEAV